METNSYEGIAVPDRTHLLYILISTLIGAAMLTALAVIRSRRLNRAMLTVLLVSAIFEQIALPRKERWYQGSAARTKSKETRRLP